MNVTNREAGQRDEVGEGVGVGGWRWGWCHIWKAPLLSDQTTSCWTLIRLGAKANTPSWVCSLCDSCVFSPLHDCFCIINHRENPELINKTQEGNTKQLGFFFSLLSDGLWILRSLVSFLGFGIRCETDPSPRQSRCQALSTTEIRQMLDREFVHWQNSWGRIQTEAVRY